tara:strand:- start:158 stop:736 length:579 start_codon:yes stop_codon:yes gene_type:complete
MNKRELRKFRETYQPWQIGEFLTESVRLAVHFEEKEWVKGLGAKWNPDPSGKGGFWTISVNKIGGLCTSGTYSSVNIFEDPDDASAGDQTVMDWLNTNRMIESLHGDFVTEMATEYAENHPVRYERYILSGDIDDEVIFDVFDIHGSTVVRQWHPATSAITFDNWHHVERGRQAWDELIASGYIPQKEKVAA